MNLNSNIFCFNPTSEMAVANGTVSWQPNSLLRQFENDLELLPSLFAGEEDVVVVQNQPENAYREQFDNLDNKLPIYYTIEQLKQEVMSGRITLAEIKPWGWSQVVYHQYKEIIPYCSEEFKDGVFGIWNPKLKDFISREFALNILSKISSNKAIYPKKCDTIEEVEIAHAANKQSMVKLPWSSSGRGLQVINRDDIHPSIKNRLQGAINQQGFVMVEKLLDRKLDFAIHFKVSRTKIQYLGCSVFNTSEDGKYSGNFLNEYLPNRLKPYADYLKGQLNKITSRLQDALEKSALKEHYAGYLGVDGLVFQRNGELEIQPCLEINLRYNMGLLAFKLEQFIAEGSHGIFHQFGGQHGDFMHLMQNKKATNPLETNNGKIASGTLPLTNPNQQSKFGAYIEVFQK